jgi:ATP/ADP translocase
LVGLGIGINPKKVPTQQHIKPCRFRPKGNWNKAIKGVEEMKFREAFENFITSKYVLGVLVVLTVYQIIQMLK